MKRYWTRIGMWASLLLAAMVTCENKRDFLRERGIPMPSFGTWPVGTTEMLSASNDG